MYALKRKIVKIFSALFAIFVLPLSAASCWFWGGYNQIMYDYFSDAENYIEQELIVESVYWYGGESGKRERYSLYEGSSEFIYREWEGTPEDELWLVLRGDEDSYCGAYSFVYTVQAENVNFLLESGGIEALQIGNTVTVKTTYWIYSDTDFRYIAYLEYDSVCYLDMETGLKNIVAYMDENRSLL